MLAPAADCVLFTASDAFLGDYRLHVDTREAEAIDWAALVRG